MKLKFTSLVLASILAAGTSAARAATVSLSLTEDPVAKTWQAFLTINNSDGSGQQATLGLHGISFNVTGGGGIAVDSSNEDLPLETEKFGTKIYNKGFKNVTSPGVNGVGIQAAQDNTNQTSSATGSPNNNILEGIGLSAGTENNGTFGTDSWTNPILIGDGTFTGSAGSLSISGSPALTTLLPSSLPTASSGGTSFATFSPLAVNGQTIPVGTPVPEPSSMLLMACGGIGLLCVARRRGAT